MAFRHWTMVPEGRNQGEPCGRLALRTGGRPRQSAEKSGPAEPAGGGEAREGQGAGPAALTLCSVLLSPHTEMSKNEKERNYKDGRRTDK